MNRHFALAVAKRVVPVLLLGLLAACPRGPSFTVRIVNDSDNKAASLLKIFDDNVGQPVSDDLLRGPDVGPGRSRTITVPLSATEGGNGFLVEAVRVDDGRLALSLTLSVGTFAEDLNYVATIFNDHISMAEEG